MGIFPMDPTSAAAGAAKQLPALVNSESAAIITQAAVDSLKALVYPALEEAGLALRGLSAADATTNETTASEESE
jgi:hypothetical protein